jgi:uncharacterized damage-inducible protein DinB
MKMKQHLLESFRYNDYANRLALARIREIRDKDECVRLFSHMINSMNKWLGRIRQSPGYTEMDWWGPTYALDELEAKWEECLTCWIDFIESKTERELSDEIEFIGFDGHDFAAVLKDIALQLNYHAIQHRSQIQYLIRQQGIAPDFVDYIGTKYRRLN